MSGDVAPAKCLGCHRSRRRGYTFCSLHWRQWREFALVARPPRRRGGVLPPQTLGDLLAWRRLRRRQGLLL